MAAARVGAEVTFISRIGKDEFGAIALATWKREGVAPRVIETPDEPTGAAYIFVNDETGDNAIIVVPGAGGSITPADVDSVADTIRSSAVFITQLEQPVESAKRGLEIARSAGVITVFNPAPAVPVDDSIYPLCDYVTPNENEAGLLSGVTVKSVEDARKAGDAFLAKGRRGGADHARRGGRAPPHGVRVDARSCLQGRSGARDDGGGRCLQRRSRGGAGARAGAARGCPLRLRRRRHLGDARRHRAVDAAAGGSGGASGAKLTRFVDTGRRCGILATGMSTMPKKRSRYGELQAHSRGSESLRFMSLRDCSRNA